MTALAIIYGVGALLTWYVGILARVCDSGLTHFQICGRAMLWPLFAIKLVCRALFAGWEDLFA